MPLEEALKSEPSLIPPKPSKPGEPQRARIVLDDPHGTARLNDLPVSFSPITASMPIARHAKCGILSRQTMRTTLCWNWEVIKCFCQG